ncbi:MAG: prenylated flavin chaperone LpdD [Methanosarcinaceae archaeon]
MQLIEMETKRGTLTLKPELVGRDILVTLTGGRKHIGATAMGTYDETTGHTSSSVITVPGHRDDIIAQKGAQRISAVTGTTSAVSVGIHFDNITDGEIQEILTVTAKMIDALIHSLETRSWK